MQALARPGKHDGEVGSRRMLNASEVELLKLRYYYRKSISTTMVMLRRINGRTAKEPGNRLA